MQQILIAGAGIIGRSVATWLQTCGDYQVHLVDSQIPNVDLSASIAFQQLDITNTTALQSYCTTHKINAIIATLPHYHTQTLAQFALTHHINYFDPTEDIKITQFIATESKSTSAAFVPQCGLAPGYINILANHYMQLFDIVEKVKLRCGALPAQSANALHYAFSWSPDGLINEYIQACEVLKDGKLQSVAGLSELERIDIDGNTYEAFHTSGGLASLAHTYEDKVQTMDYKTIRYPGHCEKMQFLLHDMKLKDDIPTLRTLLTNAIPFTDQDIVLVYVSVNGDRNGRFEKKSFTHKYYPQTVFGNRYSAIQLTTTAGICAIVDMVLQNPTQYHGYVRQEAFSLTAFWDNRFGKLLKPKDEE